MEKDIFYKFFSGKASHEEKERLKAWLEQSPEREKELLQEREFFDAILLSDPIAKVEPRQTGSLRPAKRHFLSRKVIVETMKVAALLAIVIGCGWQWHRVEMRKLTETMNFVRVPAGQRVNLTLSDGTHVWLNARSEMSYPALFAEGNRSVRLNGEAYFEVKRNEQKPFIVQTDKGNIEVLGTKFNVEAYADMPDFRTSLLEGSVRVIPANEGEKAVLLSPNNEAFLSNGRLKTQPIEDFDGFRWREGLICFRNMNFTDLMKRFEKCYGIRIVVENPTLASYVCSGKFRVSDGIDRALQILQRDVSYRIERSGDDEIIYIR